MPYTEASKRATIKYTRAHCDRIEIKSSKGLRDTVRAAADAVGQSVNAYILQAVGERMQREQANK